MRPVGLAVPQLAPELLDILAGAHARSDLCGKPTRLAHGQAGVTPLAQREAHHASCIEVFP